MRTSVFFAAAATVALLTQPAVADTIAPGDVEIVDYAVPTPLTATPGDAAAGRDWFMDRKRGNCLACHANSDMPDQPFHGEVGPMLDGVAARWSEGELRAIVVNSKVALHEDTIMPGFYRLEGLNRVAEDFEGQTILTAQEVEDVVAYLLTLTEE